MRPYVEGVEFKKPLLKESLNDKLDKFLLE